MVSREPNEGNNNNIFISIVIYQYSNKCDLIANKTKLYESKNKEYKY